MTTRPARPAAAFALARLGPGGSPLGVDFSLARDRSSAPRRYAGLEVEFAADWLAFVRACQAHAAALRPRRRLPSWLGLGGGR